MRSSDASADPHERIERLRTPPPPRAAGRPPDDPWLVDEEPPTEARPPAPPPRSVSRRAAMSAVLFAVCVLAVAVPRAFLSRPSVEAVPPRDVPVVTAPPTAAARALTAAVPAEPDASAVSPSTGVVLVHVVGQVRHPGLVRLAPGSRVADALDEAGGATRRADLAAVNLARAVVDGEQVFVPAPGQTPPAQAPSGSGAAGASPAPQSPLDLNTADESQLDALPGVGPVIAGRIVTWRSEHGRFSSVDELTEVSGIGEATLEKLRPLVRT